jgi:hypothetical protein
LLVENPDEDLGLVNPKLADMMADSLPKSSSLNNELILPK